MVRVGGSALVHLIAVDSSDTASVASWRCDQGQIDGGPVSATFKAPDKPCTADISALVRMADGDTVSCRVSLPVYRQWVVLKADDMTSSHGDVPQGFDKLFTFLEGRDIVASVGVIGISLRSGGPRYVTELRSELQTGRIEVFSHGYDHSGGTQKDSLGRVIYEFQNTPLTAQLQHLELTQDLARSQLGVTIHAFGAPYNAIDSVTVHALQEIPDIEVWYFGLPGAGKLVLPRVADAEFPAFYPNFTKFLAGYDSTQQVITLQIHVVAYTDSLWGQLGQVVDFLKNRGDTFVLPSDLYGYYHPDAQKRFGVKDDQPGAQRRSGVK